MLGTAVARMVLSSAMSAVVSMIEPSTGPRSERSPTPARAGADVGTGPPSGVRWLS